MDTETIEAIESLRGDVHQVEARLTVRIDGLDRRQEQGFEEIRRHFDVIAESLHDDIRMIAEGLVALSARVDAAFRR